MVIKVLHATYGSFDVTDVINENYVSEKGIRFSASNDVFGDPDPGGVKRLKISIQDEDLIHNFECVEGEIFTYPTTDDDQTRKALLRRLDRNKLLEYYNLSGLGIEIGAQAGWYSAQILERTSMHLVILDAWRHIEVGYNEGGNTKDDMHLYLMNHTLDLLTKKYDGRFTLMRELSETAVNFFKDELFDFIYLDANHSEEFVSSELIRWYPKLKEGGMIAGHDYVDRPGNDAFGVKSAVDKFFIDKKVEICDFGCCPTWFHIKTE